MGPKGHREFGEFGEFLGPKRTKCDVCFFGSYHFHLTSHLGKAAVSLRYKIWDIYYSSTGHLEEANPDVNHNFPQQTWHL